MMAMKTGTKTLAVDFGGTGIKIAVTDGGTILQRASTLPTAAYDSPRAIMKAMSTSMRELLHSHPDAAGIGLGMPGWVDFYRGILYQLTNVPVWNKQEPVREILEQELQLPVVLDNDANCMAYAEWKAGAGMGMENLVCLTLGTGLGGGIIIHNRMLRGKNVSCAEFGQTSIHYAGRVGPFGNRGAIEEYIGNNEFARDAAKAYAAAGISRSVAECAPHLLKKAAEAGDSIATQLFHDFAEKLACLIMNLTYTLVPDAFIIGGGVAQAGKLLFEPLTASLREQLFPVHFSALQVLPAHFGADAGIIGAGLMAADYADGKLF